MRLLNEILKEAADRTASDVHLKVGNPPVLRIGKELVNLKNAPLTNSDMESFIAELLPPKKLEYFKEHNEMDIAYSLDNVGRFRVNVFSQRGNIGIVMRRVKSEFSDFSEIGLPEVLKKVCGYRQGIVIICGPARSGKSTTIATMLNYINNSRRMHIVTIEDPIEFLFKDNQSVINQREISIDTDSFYSALKHVIRQDPDLIYIGEMRDKDSFHAAVNAAETGHIVFTTLHADSASHAVERVLNYFPAEQKDQIRHQLANNLSAIIAQRLMSAADGSLVPAVEVMLGNGIVQKLIRDNKLIKLPAAIEIGSVEGMQTFNQSLMWLVQNGKISREEALARSPNPESLKLNLQGIFLDDARRILET